MSYQRKLILGVIGASQASARGMEMAREVGAEIARCGAILSAVG